MPRALNIAAQVVIATPGVDPHTVTSRNVRSLMPDAALAERVVTAFRALGFTCGEVVGDSFSIEAAPSAFRQVFGVSPQLDPDGRVRERPEKGVRAAAKPLSELPADKLPETLRPLVKAVIFSEPPAFGPGTLP